jgi:hypothetical protein
MVRKQIVAVCLVVAALGSSPGHAAPAPENPATKDAVIDALDARVRPFLEGVSGGETQQAFDELLRGSPLLMKKTEAIQTLVEQTNQLPERFGRYRSFERFDARHIGTDLVLMRYLYKCDDFPVVWYFTFYRPPPRGEAPAGDNAWRVIIVRFDTQLEKLVE